MAKKKGSRQKKPDPQKAPLKKLESRLFGYWKKEHWGEFVTLFRRQWSKARKSQAAPYFQPAVYNLLLRTVFEEQDFSLLAHLLGRDLPDRDVLSEENLGCVQVTEILLAVNNGQASPDMAANLPSDLPAPFQRLADKLRDLLAPGKPPLEEYVQGKRKKARKGEKHLSLAVRASGQFHQLRQQNFQPRSIQSLTQFRNSLREMHDSLRTNHGLASPVLKDLKILADLMRSLVNRPNTYKQTGAVRTFLKDNGFQASDHPAVHTLLSACTALGGRFFGPDWEHAVRYRLEDQVPGIAPDLPQHVEEQLEVMRKLDRGEHHYSMLTQGMLDFDVWSARERMLLLLVQLQTFTEISHEMQREFDFDLNTNFSEFLNEIVYKFLFEISITLQDVFQLFSDLSLRDTSLLTQSVHLWQKAVAPMPFSRAQHILDQLTQKLCQSPAPDSVFLFPLLKCTEFRKQISKIKSLHIIQENRAPLQVTSDDLRQAVSYIHQDSNIHSVFQAWKTCLNDRDYQELVQIFLRAVFDQTCRKLELSSFFIDDDAYLDWTEIPEELMQHFLEIVDQDFELFGLMRLSAHVTHHTPPMPKNATEASLFLERMPPPETLDKVLSWMLTWPSTQYRNTFLAAIIRHHAEYLSQTDSWDDLATQIADNRLNALARKVWDIWTELDLFRRLQGSEDFYDARMELEAMVQKKGKKKPTPSRKKKKTLFEELLEHLDKHFTDEDED